MKKLSVVKFGGGLLDLEGKSIPTILERIHTLKETDDLGPIIVFSAPTGYTNALIGTGESYTRSEPTTLAPIFQTYRKLAKLYVKDPSLELLFSELENYQRQTEETLALVNKRFHGNTKAKVLTSGGELPTALLMEYIMKDHGFNSCRLSKEDWPIITDDNFENASPLYEESKKRVTPLIECLEEGKVVSQAGFLGFTVDGLETILERGGSDLTAVFLSCLLERQYSVETILFKEIPVQSADPLIVKDQETQHIKSLSYNEAHKASMMGMGIVQGTAISMARSFKHPINVISLSGPQKRTVIRSRSNADETVKCVTGKSGCAILTIHAEKSRSLEDTLQIWENRNDFLDLGTETLETGERIRDFLFLDSDFLKKNEKKIKGFDGNLTIEYGLGVVTLIGDRMKDSPSVASIAIGAIPKINIKRGIFAPHTSQIILVVDEKKVDLTVAAIHLKRCEMNESI